MPPQGLVWPLRVVVEEVLHQLILQRLYRLEGGPLQQVIVQGAPEPFHLPVGLRPVGPSVAVLDPQLHQHPLHGMMGPIPGRGHLRAVVGDDCLEAHPVFGVEHVDALERGEHHTQTLEVIDHLDPGQPGAGIHYRYQVVALPGAQHQIPAQVVGVQVAQLPGTGLDYPALGGLHLLGQPVETVALGYGVDGGR